jgi:bifunctional DNase/RNase
MTHDLLRNVIHQFGGTVKRVVVTELRDNTFYAVIEILLNDQPILIDSRPSDAIALALRTDCPIFVREEVVDASRSPELSRVEGEEADEDEEVEWPEELDDVGDYKM